jgi:hypothetical protein
MMDMYNLLTDKVNSKEVSLGSIIDIREVLNQDKKYWVNLVV